MNLAYNGAMSTTSTKPRGQKKPMRRTTVSEALRRAMIDSGMSAYELARRSGVNVAAVLRFLGYPQVPDAPLILSRTEEIIGSIERAGTLAELDEIRETIDAAVASVVSRAAQGEIDAQLTAVVQLAVNYVDHVLAERRELLLYEAQLAPPKPEFEQALQRTNIA